MAFRPARRGHLHSANDQRPSCNQAMSVVADADAKHDSIRILDGPSHAVLNVLRTLYLELWKLRVFQPTETRKQSTKIKVQSSFFIKASAITKSFGRVTLMFRELPSTTVIATPNRSTSELSSVSAGSSASTCW